MSILRPFDSILAAAFLAMTFVAAGAPTTNDTDADFPYTVDFKMGFTELAPGDSITISGVHGTRDIIATNETYCVEGTYTLASKDEAVLALFATLPNGRHAPVEARQTARVTKGTGTFRLIKTMGEEGYLHVSFYDVENLSGLRGVYFGTGAWVLADGTPLHKRAYHNVAPGLPDASSGPNAAILRYLGDPVPPPRDLPAAYSKQGLTDAVQLAAKNAGIAIKRIEIDESEYPFVIGVEFQDGGWPKLKEQMRKLAGYDYEGTVGNNTLDTFSLISSNEPVASMRIHRRTGLRMEMLFDKMTSSQ